ncbi:hypothetical protein ACF09L_29505 [Streptomyces sp. NPDC014779]|uniref:hypothetical protein n=1 Tax=Streptomyces sp. NPDC014779 TaxID=3364911 RepID=UPI0036F97287
MAFENGPCSPDDGAAMISATGGWAMKRGLLACVGVMLFAVIGCTEDAPPLSSPAPAPAPSSSSTPASSGSSSSPEPPEPGPATPLGAATVTAKDAKLIEAYGNGALFPQGQAVPATSELAVLRRGRTAGTGDLAWMPDANTYCLVSIRERASDRQCFGLAKERKPQGYVHVGRGAPHDLGSQAEPHQLWLSVSVVENTSGPFAYKDGTPEHATPVQEATVRFPSGRTMTFLTYEFPEGINIPMDAEICSTSRAVCFKAFEPSAAEQ